MSKTLAVRVDSIEERVAETPLRSLILESWQRSLTAGIVSDPKFILLRRVSIDDLQQRLQASQELLDIARPHLEWIHGWLVTTPHSLYLVDRDGVILYTKGNSLKVQQAFGLLPGYFRSEQTIGTNGVGTALAIDQSIIVTGKEHFTSRFHDYASIGIPLHADNKTIIGAIGLSTNVEDGSPHLLDLSTYIAQVIDKEVANRQELRRADAVKLFARVQSVTDVALGDYKPRDLLNQLLYRIRKIFEVDVAGILVKKPDGDKLLMVTPNGVVQESGRGIRIPGDSGFGAQTPANYGLVIINDLNTTEDFSTILRDNGIRSIMGSPLVIDGRMFGVAYVGMTRVHRFAEVQGRLLSEVADRVAIAIDRASRVEKERNARIEAEAANFAKGELLVAVSNKLSSSFKLVREWTELLRQSIAGETNLAHMVEAIERSNESQAQTIKNGLDVLGIIDGTVQLKLQPVEISSIITASVSLVRASAHTKSIHLQTILDSDYGLVSGDPDRIKQIICKLLLNAIKFTPGGGRVQIRFETVDSFAKISIRDTGKGIRKEFLPHLFNLFPPDDNPVTRKEGAVSLGLGRIRQLVEMHGGTIDANSMGEGHGASFIVNLPLLPTSSKPPQLARSDRPQLRVRQVYTLDDLPRLEGLRVLLIEDNSDTRDLLTFVLTQCGTETKAFGDLALVTLDSWQPDILISNLNITDGISYKLITKVSALKSMPDENIPATALPARAVVKYWMRALPVGCQIALRNPVEGRNLINTVARLV